MKLTLKRYADLENSTLGLLFIDDEFAANTLEDKQRAQKIHGKTAIPAGTYKIKFREDPTPLTMTYRNKWDGFNKHLQLQDVPGFRYVYIHVGNDEFDTEGCLLVGMGSDAGGEKITHSWHAFKKIYPKVKAALDRDEPVTITITKV